MMRHAVILSCVVTAFVVACVYLATTRPPPMTLAESTRHLNIVIAWDKLNILAMNRVLVSRGGKPLPLWWKEGTP
jgi:hypothetical protein